MTDLNLPDGWSISTEDDALWGYHWFASHRGVLWAKGWARTRIEAHAQEMGLQAARTAKALEEMTEARESAAKIRQPIPTLRSVPL